MPARPLHVAGRGAVSCFGAGLAPLLDAVFAGAVGIRPFERLAGTECLTTLAAEVPAAATVAVGAGTETDHGPSLTLQFATLAARQALAEWGGTPDRETLLVLASTKADMSGIVTPEGDGLGQGDRLARRLGEALGLDGPRVAVSSACASGLSALALAGRQLRRGAATRALVVGADSLCPFIARGFGALLALSPEPARPFDRDRQGLSLGEGAGAILLSIDPQESLGFELRGWGESNDANHVTGPSRDGDGLALATRRALQHADTSPGAIDLLHLHGTGTRYNDAMEARAMARVFAADRQPAAAGSKGQLGHTLGAAGILETLITLSALQRATTPPNVGLRRPDDDCTLSLLAPATALADARLALKVAAGFGGINVALVLARGGQAR